MLDILDKIIYLIVYFGMIIGVWLLVYPLVGPFVKYKKMSKRFRLYPEKEKSLNRNKLVNHIEMLLTVTLNTKSNYAVLTFFSLSFTLFVISLFFLIKGGGSLLINLTMSLSIGLIPYTILMVRLHNIRISSSYEAEALITELNNQYKINYFNMIEAIDKTIRRIEKQPYSQRALTRLSLAVKQYKKAEELERIIDEFNYSFDTTWSVLLANNIFLSIQYGYKVAEALDDIIEDLKDLKNINEKNKQYNHESFVMIKYIAPATYLFSVFSMFFIFGFDTAKYIDYQFKDPLGLKFFLLSIGFISLNYLIYFFIRKPKNDF